MQGPHPLLQLCTQSHGKWPRATRTSNRAGKQFVCVWGGVPVPGPRSGGSQFVASGACSWQVHG